MNKLIYVLSILCATFNGITAQSITPQKIEIDSTIIRKVKVEGNVMDKETKEDIIYATVSFFQKNKLIKEVETDEKGFYSLVLNPDIYDITISYIGYLGILQKGAEVKPDTTNRLDFAMQEGLYMDLGYCKDISVPLSTVKKDNHFPNSIKEHALLSSSFHLNGYSVISSVNSSQFNKYSNRVIDKFQSPFRAPLSNIPLYIDHTSFDYILAFINSKKSPPKDAVRIEEMVNYFNYDYPTPSVKTRPLEVFTQLTQCPWNENNMLLHIGIQGRKIDYDKLPPSNLVFLIDVSGSMSNLKKLPYIKEAFKTFLNNLRAEDKVAIVTYANGSAITLKSTRGSNTQAIKNAINNLNPTVEEDLSGKSAIQKALDIAQENHNNDGNNRIIVMTDGDFNIGFDDNEKLLDFIEKKNKTDILLSFFNFGSRQSQEDKIKLLTKKGEGNLTYINDFDAAKNALLNELGSDLNTIAKDVKIQLEFNPAYVDKYKIVGFENHKLVSSEFNEVTIDNAVLNAGHSLTLLYEITPTKDTYELVDEKLIYQKRIKNLLVNKEIGRINVSYKAPSSQKSWKFTEPITIFAIPFKDALERTKHAAAIAELGLLLKDSKHKGDASFTNVKSTLQSIDKDKYMTDEVLKLLNQVINLINVK